MKIKKIKKMMKARIRLLALTLAGCALLGAAARPAQPAQNAEKTVTIANFKFEPKSLSVEVGETVTWVNKEGAHTVTADKGEFKSPNLRSGESFSHKFTKAGTYAYHCAFHGSSGGGNMAGTIVVTAARKKK